MNSIIKGISRCFSFPCQIFMHFPICNIKHDALSYIVIYSRVTTQHFLRKHNSTNNFPKCVSPKNNVYAICDFPMITRFVSVVFVTMEPNLGQCPFTLDDAFFLAAHWEKRFLDCVWVKLLPMGPKDHMQKRSYLTRFPCCPLGQETTY